MKIYFEYPPIYHWQNVFGLFAPQILLLVVKWNEIDRLTIKPKGLVTLVRLKSVNGERISFTSLIKNFDVLIEKISEKKTDSFTI